jgi:hypothetical protein
MKVEISKKYRSKKERLPFNCENLENPQCYFISKQNLTLQYTKLIREDIISLMKEKQIGWTEICRKLQSIKYTYSPISMQQQVKGKNKHPRDIKYFVPILILLRDLTI